MNAQPKVVTKSARYPVRLSCGHDTLVTSATWYGGSALCGQCPQGCHWWARSRRITGSLGLPGRR